MYASAQIVPRMLATVQKRLRWSAILAKTKFCAKAIVQNVSTRTDKESVDSIDGFLDQTKRGSK